jgi:DNA-binding GntR family transcriptional regulator
VIRQCHVVAGRRAQDDRNPTVAFAEGASRQPLDGELQNLEAAINDMDDAIKAGDLEAWAQADDRFHTELVRLGKNARIEAIVAMMSDQVKRARALTLFMRPLPVKSNEDHRMVFEAIKRGDADAAHRIHKNHRQNAKDMLIALLRTNRLSRI